MCQHFLNEWHDEHTISNLLRKCGFEFNISLQEIYLMTRSFAEVKFFNHYGLARTIFTKDDGIVNEKQVQNNKSIKADFVTQQGTIIHSINNKIR